MIVDMTLENSNEKLCTEKNDFCHVKKRITYGNMGVHIYTVFKLYGMQHRYCPTRNSF